MYKASGTEIITHYTFCFSNSWETLTNKEKQMENASRADLKAWFSHLLIMWPQASLSFLICKKKLIFPDLLTTQNFSENKINQSKETL